MQTQASSLHFTTDAFAPHEKVAAWREVYGTLVELNFEPARTDAFSGEARMRLHPGLGLGSITMGQTGFSKPCSLARSDDVLLVTLESGRMACTALGRDVYLQPGDAVLGWTTEAVSGQVEGDISIVRIPTAAIAPMVRDIGAGVQQRIHGRTDTLQLLRPYLRTLMDHSIAPALQRLATTHVCDLIALMCGASGEAAAIAADRGGRGARLRAIKHDIAQNLENGDVSLAAIVKRHRVSPRSVQKLFNSDGTTFSEYVLDQRLVHARRALSDPRRAAEKIATIAFDAGFGDVSYFYRAFRTRFGASPSEMRGQAQRPN
jgi:AraC-like DNA-binding protein